MKLDISIHRGMEDKPVVIFIHGLGMNKDIWVDPLSTKIFSGNIPLKVFIAKRPQPCNSHKSKKISVGDIPGKLDNLWNALKDKGFNLVCWSQRRPVGPILYSVEELGEIMDRVKIVFPERPIALVGHSRGGLIARKFMEKRYKDIRALITISTPHGGSAIAGLGKYIKPLYVVLEDILPKNAHGILSRVIRNVADLLKGDALKELLPGSDFFKDLCDLPHKNIDYMSFGGTEPRMLTVYVWKKKDKKRYPKALLSIPDSLFKILPASVIMNEITPGKGDGLVTAKSSLLPWSSSHYDLEANHVSVMWHRKTINRTVKVLRAL